MEALQRTRVCATKRLHRDKEALSPHRADKEGSKREIFISSSVQKVLVATVQALILDSM